MFRMAVEVDMPKNAKIYPYEKNIIHNKETSSPDFTLFLNKKQRISHIVIETPKNNTKGKIISFGNNESRFCEKSVIMGNMAKRIGCITADLVKFRSMF